MKVGKVKILVGPFQGMIGIIADSSLNKEGEQIYLVRVSPYQVAKVKETDLQTVSQVEFAPM